MRLRTVKLSAEKSLSKRKLSGSIFFLLSAFEIRWTENQRRQPDGTFIRNLTPPVAQKSGESSSFIVSGTEILTVTAFIRRKRKNVYRFERGRWHWGDNDATGHGINVISVLSCWSLCNTMYPEVSSNPHTLLLRSPLTFGTMEIQHPSIQHNSANPSSHS